MGNTSRPRHQPETTAPTFPQRHCGRDVSRPYHPNMPSGWGIYTPRATNTQIHTRLFVRRFTFGCRGVIHHARPVNPKQPALDISATSMRARCIAPLPPQHAVRIGKIYARAINPKQLPQHLRNVIAGAMYRAPTTPTCRQDGEYIRPAPQTHRFIRGCLCADSHAIVGA